MNIAYFQMLLQKAIDNSTSTMDWLFLSRALANLNMGQIRAVAAYSNLPSAAANEGLLVWVTADERLYWSTGTEWFSLNTTGKGIAYSWGDNLIGQLGNNSTVSVSSPVSVIGNFNDWSVVERGYLTSLAVRSNGSAWAWGSNANLQLGQGGIGARSSPISVSGGFKDWAQVELGLGHSVGLRCNGTLWSWGSGCLGALGNNSTSDQSSPVQVVGGFADWCQIDAGRNTTVAVRTNGTAWSWGDANFGKLGNGYCFARSSPVSVIGGFTDWCQLTTARYSSAGVRSNGSVWAWGRADSGMLGNNTTTGQASPVSVVGGFADWCRVSSSPDHMSALRNNGTAWSWGCNQAGRLGDNTTIDRSSPVSVVGGFTDWCQVDGGCEHVAALRTNGTAWSWGSNSDLGALGDNTTVNRSSPVSVVGGFSDWCQISAGAAGSLAIRTTNFV